MPNGEIKSEIPTSPTYYPLAPKKKKSKVLWIVIGVIVLAVIGVGVSLASRVWDPLWNPFRPTPAEVIEKMNTEMEGLRTFHLQIKINVNGKEDKEEIFNLLMDFATDLDKSDPQNLKSASEFYVNFDMVGEGGMAFAGEGKAIGKDSYLKLTIIPPIPYPGLPVDVNQFKNQWIKIDEESIENLIKELGMPIGLEREKAKQKQQEMIQKLQDLLKGKKLYLVKKEYLDQEVSGKKTYHYLVTLNKEEIKKLIPELLKTLIEMEVFPQPPTEAEWKKFEEEFPKEFDKFFQKMGDIEGQIWIGKKDNFLYKIKGEKEIDLQKFEKTEKGKITINFEMNFSNFNQPAKIEVPTEYKTLEEIFKLTSEFETYHNKQYSYQIDYPKNWEIDFSESNNPNTLHQVIFRSTSAILLSPPMLQLQVHRFATLEEISKELYLPSKLYLEKEITVNQKKGTEVWPNSFGSVRLWIFPVKEKNKTYIITCSSPSPPNICDQLVKTFVIE